MLQSEARIRWNTGGHQDCQDAKWDVELAEPPHLKRSRLSASTSVNHPSANRMMSSPPPSVRPRPPYIFSPPHSRSFNPNRVCFYNNINSSHDSQFPSSSQEPMGRQFSSMFPVFTRSSAAHGSLEDIPDSNLPSFRRNLLSRSGMLGDGGSDADLLNLRQSPTYSRVLNTIESSALYRGDLQSHDERNERDELSRSRFEDPNSDSRSSRYCLRKRSHERNLPSYPLISPRNSVLFRGSTSQTAYRQRLLRRRRQLHSRSTNVMREPPSRRSSHNISFISQFLNSSHNDPTSGSDEAEILAEDRLLQGLTSLLQPPVTSRLPDLHSRPALADNVCTSSTQENLLQPSTANKNSHQVLRESNLRSNDTSSSIRSEHLPCVSSAMNTVPDMNSLPPRISSSSSFVSTVNGRAMHGHGPNGSNNHFVAPPSSHSFPAVSFNPVSISASSLYGVPLLPHPREVGNHVRPPSILPIYGAGSRHSMAPATVLQLTTSHPATVQATVFHSLLPPNAAVSRLSCLSGITAASVNNYRVASEAQPVHSVSAVNLGPPNCYLFRQSQPVNGSAAHVPLVDPNHPPAISRHVLNQTDAVTLPYDRFLGMAVRCSTNPIVSAPRPPSSTQGPGELGLAPSYLLAARTAYGVTPLLATSNDVSPHIFRPSGTAGPPPAQFYATSDNLHQHSIHQAAISATVNTLYWQRHMLQQQQQHHRQQASIGPRLTTAMFTTAAPSSGPGMHHPPIQVSSTTVAPATAYRLIPVPTLTATTANVTTHYPPHPRIFNITSGAAPTAATTFAFPALSTLVLPRKRGLSRHELDDLTTYRYDRGAASGSANLPVTTSSSDAPASENEKADAEEAHSKLEELKCMVCLDEVEENDLVKVLRCGHEFHHKCVDKWLRSNRSCPICRRDGYTGLAQSAADLRAAATN